MDRKSAFEVIRKAIEAAPTKPGDEESAQFKDLAVAALSIAEESLKDFAKMAEAVRLLSFEPRTISYSGPLGFRVVGNVAETFDPSSEDSQPSLFDQKG
jgi:hypothetical protein